MTDSVYWQWNHCLEKRLILTAQKSQSIHKSKGLLIEISFSTVSYWHFYPSIYPSFFAMPAEIWWDRVGGLYFCCFLVFAMLLSLLTACYSPSVYPLHHCQVIACSWGTPECNGERKQNEQWTAAIFEKAVIHLRTLKAEKKRRGEVEMSRMVKRNGGAVELERRPLLRGVKNKRDVFDKIIYRAAWGQHITQTHWTYTPLALSFSAHSVTHIHTNTNTNTSFGSCQCVQAVLLILSSPILFTVMSRPTQHCGRCCRKHTHQRFTHTCLHMLYVLYMQAGVHSDMNTTWSENALFTTEEEKGPTWTGFFTTLWNIYCSSVLLSCRPPVCQCRSSSWGWDPQNLMVRQQDLVYNVHVQETSVSVL